MVTPDLHGTRLVVYTVVILLLSPVLFAPVFASPTRHGKWRRGGEEGRDVRPQSSPGWGLPLFTIAMGGAGGGAVIILVSSKLRKDFRNRYRTPL